MSQGSWLLDTLKLSCPELIMVNDLIFLPPLFPVVVISLLCDLPIPFYPTVGSIFVPVKFEVASLDLFDLRWR